MNYGFGKFIFDVALTVLTGGFWLIWIFIREMRKHR
jgi:ABC-type enterobactin transport system permease subunit